LDPIKLEAEQLEGLEHEHDEDEAVTDRFGGRDTTMGEQTQPNDELLQIRKVAQFEFRPPQLEEGATTGSPTAFTSYPPPPPPPTTTTTPPEDSTAQQIPLPDIREAKARKQARIIEQQELEAMKEENEKGSGKIKRSDKQAFLKLLEQQPFADADDSLFEPEAYDTVSALLGERAKPPLLGIPVGPLQVGHFVGALGVALMAFVEYPGFPLTSLPTPVRDALQGSLAGVYGINCLLAVLAFMQAQERGQSGPLWALKTLSVGGLALDQLRQLPTLEQQEKAKGSRSRSSRVQRGGGGGRGSGKRRG
jgi:hypothetical protein